MYQMKLEGNGQTFQGTTENQHTALFPAPLVSDVPQRNPTVPSSTGTSFPLYDEMFNYMQQCWMYSLSGVHTQLKQDGMVTLEPLHRTGPQLLQTMLGTYEQPAYNMDAPHGPNSFGSVAAGDLGNCHVLNPTSNTLKVESGVGGHGSQKPLEDVLRKRELRLLKNREAARECRRKKKEYVRCLENRVAVLEQQNMTLIQELRALKDIYRPKAE